MTWARTARIDAKQAQHFTAALLPFEGVRAQVHDSGAYALVEGPDSTDPAEIAVRVPAHWFDEAIVVLAIEPKPADALHELLQTLSGPGRPAGVIDARIEGGTLVVEFSPQTSPMVLTALVDAELRRYDGTRTAKMLAPLPTSAWAAIAAHGLQAPEIAPSRILESLLKTHVE